MTTTEHTSVAVLVPLLISSCTQESASESHTASERVAPPSTSVVRMDPLWSTTTTVCDVQTLVSNNARFAARCSRSIVFVISTSGTSNLNPGSGHDVISLELVSSVMKTTPANVYYQRRTTPLDFDATSFLPYLTAACRSRLEIKRSLRRCRPCAEERISTKLVVEEHSSSVSLMAAKRSTHERERAR
jgi:hypothetical protein